MAEANRDHALTLLRQALDMVDRLGTDHAAAALVAQAIDLLERRDRR